MIYATKDDPGQVFGCGMNSRTPQCRFIRSGGSLTSGQHDRQDETLKLCCLFAYNF